MLDVRSDGSSRSIALSPLEVASVLTEQEVSRSWVKLFKGEKNSEVAIGSSSSFNQSRYWSHVSFAHNTVTRDRKRGAALVRNQSIVRNEFNSFDPRTCFCCCWAGCFFLSFSSAVEASFAFLKPSGRNLPCCKQKYAIAVIR